MKGYLHKKGHVIKNWKTRFFVLTRESLVRLLLISWRNKCPLRCPTRPDPHWVRDFQTYWETGACVKQKGIILLTNDTLLEADKPSKKPKACVPHFSFLDCRWWGPL
jgi:hypothetical protein